MIAYTLSRILWTEAALLLLPLSVGLGYGEPAYPFLIPIAFLLLLGLALGIRQPADSALYAKDGFLIVSLAWILMSAMGALPFVISRDIPNYVDAFFETVSGFTTTGASILTEIESLSRGILFWRSFTHWVGGMGVLVFVMAIIPMTNDGHGMHILRAEMPGPTAGKLVSRMSDTAKILYGIYFVMTAVEIVILVLCGMPLYDSAVSAFGTAGTGGFSVLNSSIGGYGNPAAEVVIGIFMLLFAANFNLYYFLLVRRFRDVFLNEELRAYLAIAFGAVAIITVDILRMCSGLGEALRLSFFQVSSIMSTTGFGTTDFDLWPSLSKGILVMLMFIGGCAGSTGGGIKVIRIHTLAKASLCDLRKMLHPNAVIPVRVDGRSLPEKEIRGVRSYFVIFFFLFSISFLLLSL